MSDDKGQTLVFWLLSTLGREAGFSATLLNKNVSSFGRNDKVFGWGKTKGKTDRSRSLRDDDQKGHGNGNCNHNCNYNCNDNCNDNYNCNDSNRDKRQSGDLAKL
jgi:hypothetical protein